MDARTVQFNEIMVNNKLFEIPFYQRRYVWKEDEWKRLLDDVTNMCRARKPEFFGSLIFKEQTVPVGSTLGNAGHAIVVDGQQRLTSLIILMKVLALHGDVMDTGDGAGKNLRQRNFDGIFFNEDYSGNQYPSLKHNRIDVHAFDKILRLKKLGEPLADDNQVARAFNFFASEVRKQSFPIREVDSRDVLNFSQFVAITVEAKENEQRIFDSINSLGMKLTTGDLLKNFLFEGARAKKFDEFWVPVMEKDEDTVAYWDTNVSRRSLSDWFFDAVLRNEIAKCEETVTDKDQKEYDKGDRLQQSYKDFISRFFHLELTYGERLDLMISNIREAAEKFREIFDPTLLQQHIDAKDRAARLNVIVFGLGIGTVVSYVLYLALNVEDEKKRNEMYGMIESYIMRRIVAHESASNYNQFFWGLVHDQVKTPEALRDVIEKQQDTSTTYVSDTSLENAVLESGKSSNLQNRAVLYLLELASQDPGSATQLSGFNSYSLEHLMPKAWQTNWDSEGLTAAEKADRDRALLTLGNLAILPVGLNKTISNASWNVKLSGKGKKAGLRGTTKGLLTMQYPLEQSEWTVEKIRERGEQLYEMAKKIWVV